MRIATIVFRLRAPWVHSLKEKRMIVKSLVAKLRNRYNVSASEIDEQDICCIVKIPKVADKNGESCISILEKIAG